MASDVAIKLNIELDLSDIRKEGQAIGNILQRALNKNTRTKVLDSLEKQIASAYSKIQKFESSINEVLSNPMEHTDFFSFSDEFNEAYSNAKRLEGEVSKIVNLARELPELANASISEVADYLEVQSSKTIGARRGNKRGTVTGISPKIADDIKMLREYAKYYEILERETQNVQGNEKFEAMGEAVDRLREKIQNLIEDYRRASLNSGNVIQNGLQPIINFNQEISQTMGAFSQAFGPYVQIATTAVRGLVEVTELEVKALAKLGQVAISAFKPLVSLAQLAGSAIKKMFDSIKKHNETTMKNLWRNVLKYGIGVRSFYFLARKIRAVIGDVINELAKQIPEVNAQMSAFQTAVNGLKGSLATAFQPILTAVLPILTKLINMVSRAIAVVGQFFALLTGQKFVYAATATQVDYAASLDKTGKSAKKAKKELEGYLSPIDEINKYQSKKDDDSGGGGGGDFTLKKVPIDDWMKDFWDKVKQSWDHADFFDLGKALGDKIAKALAQIPWAEIRAKARQLGRSLATLLNGIMHGEFNGKSLATYIGQTIAGAINTAFDFVDSWVSAFEWDTLGKSIMEVIKGALDNLDWNLITGTLSRIGTGIGKTLREIFNDNATWAAAGEALARGINSLIYMIYNVFNQVSGAQVGAAISRFLNKFIEWIDSKAFVTTCNEIMRDILDALIVAIATTQWDDLGIKLAEAFNQIDFAGIFSRYARLANVIIDAILDLLTNFVQNLDAEKLTEIGTSIADAINSIDIQPERLGKLANVIIQSLLTIIYTTISETDWGKVANDVADMLAEIDWSTIIGESAAIKAKLEQAVFLLIAGVVTGIRRQIFNKALDFVGLGEDSADGFTDGVDSELSKGATKKSFKSYVIDAIKAILEIHSPSKVFEGFGKNVVDGFINGIQDIISKASKVWNDLKTTTVGIFNDMWTNIKGVINSIIGGVEAMANGIVKGLNKAIEAMNNLQFDVPGWVPLVGGEHLGFNIPTIGEISIPRLAQGAVIPPNREFMAVLGDQRNGTNIETPLDTMIEAFNTALRQNGGGSGRTEINFLLPDRRKVAQYVVEGGRIMQTSTGRNPFELA